MVQLARHLFTVDEFQRMAEAGIFGDDDRIELLEGEIVHMAAIGSRHAAVVDRLNKLLGERLGQYCIVRVQSSIRLDDKSQPQPDISLLRLNDKFYFDSLPTPSDVLLAVEVADSSADIDRTVKVPMYAKAGILEVWIVEIKGKRIEAYSKPDAAGYSEVRVAGLGDSLSPTAIPDVAISVADFLG